MLEYVDELPPLAKMGKTGGVNLSLLNEFLASGRRVARVSREWVTSIKLRQTLSVVVQRTGAPVVVNMRGGQVYLSRTDMESDNDR